MLLNQRIRNMLKQTFYIVDVFADEKYAGNQLAVVRDAKQVSAADMQKIAKEMHFSETSFILSDKMDTMFACSHLKQNCPSQVTNTRKTT